MKIAKRIKKGFERYKQVFEGVNECKKSKKEKLKWCEEEVERRRMPTRENTPRPEPGLCGCGPCVCGEPSASQSQWLETASGGAASSILLWAL